MKRKISMLLVFIFGVAMLATSVLASTINKTGYELLRDSVKTSFLEYQKMSNYTFYQSYKMTYDGKEIASQNSTTKKVGKVSEVSSYNKNLIYNQENNNYTYQDELKTINSSDGINYYWQDKNASYQQYPGIFDESEFNQIFGLYSKIADAAVATFNMQNAITATKQTDGSYNLEGSIGEGQVPVLINAVFSALFKTTYSNSYSYRNGNNNNVSIDLTEDVYIKSFTGNAHINKDGLADKGYFKAIISGKDNYGKVHNLEVEVYGEAKDFNSTTITEPDLTGKTVVKNQYNNPYESTVKKEDILPLLGKYKKDNTEIRDGKLIKIGETILDFKNITDGNVVEVDIITNDKDGNNISKENNEFFVQHADTNIIQMGLKNGDNVYKAITFDINSGSIRMYGNQEMIFTRVFD